MCDICRVIPCLPQCPNAPDPPIVFICSGCGCRIREGDDYWDFFGEQFCCDCVDNHKGVAEYDPY